MGRNSEDRIMHYSCLQYVGKKGFVVSTDCRTNAGKFDEFKAKRRRNRSEGIIC